MRKTISFILNGEFYTTKSTLNISDLLFYFDSTNMLCILEYNGLIYPKLKWDHINIEDNAQIEIVTIVGGG